METLNAIKAINPGARVIMRSGNEDIGTIIDAIRAEAKSFVRKGVGSWKKVARAVEDIITSPVRTIIREFGVSKYVVMFLTTFVSTGLIVLNLMNNRI